ncbi:UDP-glycosyltransferase 92A1-like [Nymphaea colorata]|uniref:UDP-glycosyltransferase 92A1-like n=1 Tax=Nymphaea colorata TaxID=210225 RepID=UPI00129E2FB1|nr:UDP-glycosyltransferase 92A1-like [Nymphaea colorata]
MGHIVMLPFLAWGHFKPFVTFANLIIHHHPSHTITIATTPLNLPKLRSILPPSTPIRLAALPFDPSSHGLPPDGDCTDFLPPPLIVRLCYASRALRPALERHLRDLPVADQPPCLIADILFGWTVDVASITGAFHAFFATQAAYGFCIYMSLWLHLPQAMTDSDEFELPDFPDVRLHRTQISAYAKTMTPSDPWPVFLREEWALRFGTGGLLVNSVREMEPKGMERLRTLFPGRPIWSIGPALPSALPVPATESSSSLAKRPGISPEDCTRWLDHHPPGSVLYMSFGSQNTISASQMKALAKGLAESGVAFIWVVRPPVEFKLEEEFRSSEWLPKGFEDRIREKKRGLVVRNWAPQLTILAHESTGGFLSHCGWNSVLESLSHGVPLIGWPIAAEQFYNSKMMEEEMGVGVELARGNQAEVRKEEVVRVVALAMGETEKREEMRRKASEVREVLRGAWRKQVGDGGGGNCVGSSFAAMNDFLETAFSR